jgi:hypothetical protein
MPAPLVAIFWSSFLGSMLPKIIFRGLAALGIGVVVYQGMDTLFQNGSTYIQGKFGDIQGVIPAVFELITYLKVDVALSMVIAAAISVTAIKPIRWVMKS